MSQITFSFGVGGHFVLDSLVRILGMAQNPALCRYTLPFVYNVALSLEIRPAALEVPSSSFCDSHVVVRIDVHTTLSTVIFADDQVLTAESEQDLQRAVFQLQNILKNYNKEISEEKKLNQRQ
jgi:hypothetical protein